MCEKQQSKSWQKIWLDAEKAWYMISGDQWITYEDVDSAALKVRLQRDVLIVHETFVRCRRNTQRLNN